MSAQSRDEDKERETGGHQPARPHPNESENQPTLPTVPTVDPENEGRRADRSPDDGDEISSPAPGGIDPDQIRTGDGKQRVGHKRTTR